MTETGGQKPQESIRRDLGRMPQEHRIQKVSWKRRLKKVTPKDNCNENARFLFEGNGHPKFHSKTGSDW
ncbi:hypothetical protein BN1002_02451 [Bacillus sp. B-jedd]|nr:hypothetical protein BN1002_02451 [Bacillus sp. B-jedd]